MGNRNAVDQNVGGCTDEGGRATNHGGERERHEDARGADARVAAHFQHHGQKDRHGGGVVDEARNQRRDHQNGEEHAAFALPAEEEEALPQRVHRPCALKPGAEHEHSGNCHRGWIGKACNGFPRREDATSHQERHNKQGDSVNAHPFAEEEHDGERENAQHPNMFDAHDGSCRLFATRFFRALILLDECACVEHSPWCVLEHPFTA